MLKRIVSLFLVITLCVGMVPVSVLANENPCVCTELCAETGNPDCPHCTAGNDCAYVEAVPEPEPTDGPPIESSEPIEPTTEPAEKPSIPVAPKCPHGNEVACNICSVEALIAALPSADQMLTNDNDGRNTIYADLLAATDAYDLLSAEEQESVVNLDQMIALHAAFSQLIAADPEGADLASISFENTEMVAGQTARLTITWKGTGRIISRQYQLMDETGVAVRNWSYGPLQSGITTLSSSVTIEAAGSYYCEVTITDEQGNVYTARTPNPVVVTNGLRLNHLSVSSERISFGSKIVFTLDTQGEGSFTDIQFEIKNQETGDVEKYPGSGLQTPYQPSAAGNYTVKATVVTDKGHVFSSSESFVVYEGLCVKELRVLSSQSDWAVGDEVSFYAFTCGEGKVADATFEVFGDMNQPALDTVSGTSLAYSFTITDPSIKSYVCIVTLTDEDGNKSTDKAWFNIASEEQEYPRISLIADPNYYNSYLLGDTIPFRVIGENIDPIENVTYLITRVDASWDEKPYQTFADMTDSFDYTPDQGGKFACHVTVTTVNGDSYSTYSGLYFTVTDAAFVLKNVSASRYEVPAGESITFFCNTEGSGDYESISYEIVSRNAPQSTVYDSYTGRELSYTYHIPKDMDEDYMVCNVTAVRENGTIYSKHVEFRVESLVSCMLDRVEVSSEVIALGETVRLSSILRGNGSYQSIDYKITSHDVQWPNGVQTFVNQGTSFSYTPTEIGRYSCEVILTKLDGTKVTRDTRFTVTSSLQVISLSVDAENASVGQPIVIKPVTTGEGMIVQASFEIFNGNVLFGPGEDVADYSGTSPEYVFVPEKGGYYTCTADFVNDEGVSFTVRESFNVQEGLCLTDIQCSKPVVAVGEPITFTPVFAGQGTAENMHYWIMFNHGDTMNSYVQENAPIDNFTWMPTSPGVYGCHATMINDQGVLSAYTADFEVVEESLTLTQVTLDKDAAWIGDTITATANLSGSGSLATAAYTLFYKENAEAEVQEISTVSNTNTTFQFVPDKAGLWWVEADMTTGNGKVFHKESAVLTVTTIPEGSTDSGVQLPSGSGGNTDLSKAEVGGLDVEAEAWAEPGKEVTITVSMDYVPADTTSSDAAAIFSIANVKTVDLVEIGVSKSVDGESSPLHETKTVLDLRIPFDARGKPHIEIIRVHNGVASVFTALSAPPANPVDGTYYVDRTTMTLHLYSSCYSLYGIGYDTSATITYMDGTKVLKTEEYVIGEGLKKLYEPSKHGYRFAGWYAEKELKTRVRTIDTSETEDITLYAKWRRPIIASGENPFTGDRIMIPVIVLVLSAAALTGLIVYLRKKKRQ